MTPSLNNRVTRVALLVDTVTEAHDELLLRVHLADLLLCLLLGLEG